MTSPPSGSSIDADQYLDDLIGHLVALASAPGASGSADSVRPQVEAAAAALEAAGLVLSRGVSEWGEAADTALEKGGLIQRIHVQSVTHTNVAALGGQGEVRPPREEPRPGFVRLVPIGREFELPDAERLVLLSLTLWDHLFELNYARLDAENDGSGRVFGRRAERDWEIVDDDDMRYRVGGAGGGGGGRMRRETVRVYPAVRADASSLRLTLRAGDLVLATTEVAL